LPLSGNTTECIHSQTSLTKVRKLLTRQQSKAVVSIVKEQNDITLKQIQQQIIVNNKIFSSINSINISTIHRTLKRNNVTLKTLDITPVGRNTPSTIEKRYKYVRESIRASSERTIFLEEAGFNLHLCRYCG